MRRVLMILFVGAIGACWMGDAARLFADEAESVAGLRKEKVKAAQEWWEVVVARDHAGSPAVSPGEEFRAAKALKNAELDVAADKQARIRALAAYRDRMQSIYDKTEIWFKTATAGGEVERVAEAKIRLLDAKIRLKEEEAK